MLAFTPLLLAVASCGQVTDRKVKVISVVEARRLWREAQARPESSKTVFVDARSSAKYQEGHIPGAVNLVLTDLPKTGSAPQLRGADFVVVYGADPGSPGAMGLAKRLIAQDYDGVYLLQGGLLSWRINGGELHPPAVPKESK